RVQASEFVHHRHKVCMADTLEHRVVEPRQARYPLCFYWNGKSTGSIAISRPFASVEESKFFRIDNVHVDRQLAVDADEDTGLLETGDLLEQISQLRRQATAFLVFLRLGCEFLSRQRRRRGPHARAPFRT